MDAAQDLARRWPSVDQIQFAVEEVPPSDPAPWERSVVLGRGFTAEPRAGLPARVVIYRRPVASRATNEAELADLVRRVVVEVPAKVAAVRLSTGNQESSSGTSRTSSGLAAATIVTAQAGGDMDGTLISTVPAQPDATVQAQRRILLD